MFCKGCGAPMAVDARFCAKCGAGVDGTVASADAPLVAKRPTGVLLLATYDFVGGLLGLLLGSPLVAFSLPESRVGAVVGSVLFLLGVLRIVAGIGMLRRLAWGRKLHLGVSIPSILNFPVGTAMAIVSFVYLERPLVKLWFAKPDTGEWSSEEREQWRAAGIGAANPAVLVGVLGGIGFLFVMYVGVVAAIAIPNLLNAIDRGKQKRTMADMRAIGRAVEAYKVDTDVYPDVQGQWVPADHLASYLEPVYIKAIPGKDGWGNEMMVRSDGTHYQIASLGKMGIADVKLMQYTDEDEGTTQTFDSDILFSDGRFVRYPEGVQQ